MKRVIAAIMSVSLCSFAARAEESPVAASTGTPSTFFIVRITDHMKVVALKLLSSDELKALNSEISTEGRLWDKAMEACETQWEKEQDASKKPFPKGSIAPRKIVVDEQFFNQEKGSERLAELDKKRTEEEESDKKREEERLKQLTTLRGSRQLPFAVAGKARAAERKKKSEEEYMALQKKAVDLFERKLTELATGDSAAVQPVPAEEKQVGGQSAKR